MFTRIQSLCNGHQVQSEWYAAHIFDLYTQIASDKKVFLKTVATTMLEHGCLHTTLLGALVVLWHLHCPDLDFFGILCDIMLTWNHCRLVVKRQLFVYFRIATRLRLRNDLYCVGWGVKLYSLIATRRPITAISHQLFTTVNDMRDKIRFRTLALCATKVL